MTRTSRTARRPRRGAALVEFAVVVPLLMLLFVGSIEIGRAIIVRQTLCEASRAGARVYAMQTKKDADDAKAIVDQIMADAGLKNYTVALDPPPGTKVAQLDPMTVTVSMSAADASWYPTPWFLGNENLLRSSCVMPADLNESMPGDAIDAGNPDSGPIVDGDDVAELSGDTNSSVKLLEEEAQKLVAEAQRLRDLADDYYAQADAHLQTANSLPNGGDDDDDDDDDDDENPRAQELKRYEEDLKRAKSYDAQATAAEEEARKALLAAAKAST